MVQLTGTVDLYLPTKLGGARIAVVQEWNARSASSEVVLEQILASLPNADLFALTSHPDAEGKRRLAGRMLRISFIQRLPLVGAAILNQSVFAMATYLRAHRREPYLAPTVVGAVALGTWTLVAGPLVGATGLAYAHLVVTLIVGWAWGLLIFRHCRTTWHKESAPKAIPSDSTHD